MRRPVLLGIATTIMITMAAGAIAAALFVSPGMADATPAVGEGADVVRRFYAAANEVIATGDPTPLQTVAAPHFVDVEPLPGVAPGRAGLEAWVLALHAADPEMRLEVEEIVAAADRVVARVRVRNSPELAPLGGSVLDHSPSWGAVESFRVSGGRIVERRSAGADLAAVRPLADAAFAFAAPSPRVVTVKRFTFAPGARWDALPLGPRLLVLETGTLQLEPGQDQVESEGRQAMTLSQGGSYVATADERFSATNLGAGEARLLIVAFSVPLASSQWLVPEEAFLSGITAQTLAGGMATDVGIGPVTVTLGRAIVARDAHLSLTSAAGPVLLAVDAGQADLAAWGMAFKRRGEDGMSAPTREATVAVGDGLLLQPDGLIALRGAGTEAVEALLVMVREASAAPSEPAA